MLQFTGYNIKTFTTHIFEIMEFALTHEGKWQKEILIMAIEHSFLSLKRNQDVEAQKLIVRVSMKLLHALLRKDVDNTLSNFT